MQQAELSYHVAAILSRLAGPDLTVLSLAAAKSILTLGFSPLDNDRMHDLAAKAHAGTLTREEQAEVEAYSRIGSLLGILKSKARRRLKRRRPAARGKHPEQAWIARCENWLGGERATAANVAHRQELIEEGVFPPN